MRILVLQGSPRGDKGITDIVLKRFVKGIQNAVPDTELSVEYLAEKNIGHCRGCLGCWLKTPGACRFKDDMEGLIQQYLLSDVVIPATPMYVDGMTSHMKKFWERLLPVMKPYFNKDGPEKIRHGVRHRDKKGLFLIATCAMPELEQFKALVNSFESMAYNFNMGYLGQLLRPESHSLTYTKKYGDRISNVLLSVEKCGEEFGRNLSIPIEVLSAAQDSITGYPGEFLDINNSIWDKLLGVKIDKM